MQEPDTTITEEKNGIGDPEHKAPLDSGNENRKILRFNRSERLVHWAIAIPFLVCYTTALILVVHYNPNPSRPFRDIFSWIHRISGICLATLPMLAVFKSSGDMRIHFYNIRQAWTWVLDDFKWLALMGLAAFTSKISLPEQGKFNAAEKLNFMVLMATYPLYILTGLLIWLTHGAFVAWIVHFMMAVVATPLIFGHMYMAMINRSGRKGLQGMISGYVDRTWARHHYRRWYREHHEDAVRIGDLPESSATEQSIEEYTHNSPAEVHATPVTSIPVTSIPDSEQLEKPSDVLERKLMSHTVDERHIPVRKLNYYLGLAYEGAGKVEQAIEQYEKFLDSAGHTGSEQTPEDSADARSRLKRIKANKTL